jgi:hypothetical protein
MADPVPEMVERVKQRLDTFDLDSASGFYQEELVKAARAVIEEMRVPTEAMINAACHQYAGGPDGFNDIWQAMVDAALNE